MRWSDLPLHPSARVLRQFAGVWILFFGSIAAWHYAALGHSRVALVLGLLAVTVGPLGVAVPAAVRPIFVAWLVVTFPIGWVVSRLLMMALFWGVMTPVALMLRLGGRDLLMLRRPQDRSSFWRPKEPPRGMPSYFRQY